MEEQQENVAEELQQEEVVTPQESSPTPEPTSQEKENTDKEVNFKKLREAKEQLENENRTLKEYLEKSTKPQSKEEDYGIDDDDIVEGKVVKKLFKELDTLKKTYEQEKLQNIPDRLKNKFSDFDQVVTKENVEKLKQSEPELYASIISGNDLYTKGVSAYKALKRFGIAEGDDVEDTKSRIAKNQSKPMSTQAIKGQSSLSDGNAFAKGLTPELRKQLQKEMSEAVKAR